MSNAENKDTKEVNLSNNEAITIPQETFPEFKTNIELIKKEAYYRDREVEKAVKTGRGSISIRKDGVVSASSNHISTIQLTPDGIAAQTSPYFGIKNNTHSVDSKDHIINGHKLNNKLYELSDFKKVLDGYDQTAKIVGGLTMLGTVLVRAWEPNLKRYVLVRRLINIPMFSPALGSLETPKGLGIQPNTNTIKELMSQINTTGISSYAQLATQLEQKRQEAIKKQEESTTEKMKKLIEEVSKQQVTSMSTLTGQDPTQFGASQLAANALKNMTGTASNQHGGGGGSFGVVQNASQFSDGYQWMDPTGANTDSRNQCASFASQMMKQAGIDIEVCMNGDVLANQFKTVGAYHTPGSGYQPQAGDLIDWAHHVGIYAGNGEYIARNSSGGVKRGSMSGMEQYFGSLLGYGSISELQRAKGHSA